MRITQNKLKRLVILAFILFTVELVLVGMSSSNKVNKTALYLERIKDDEITYIANTHMEFEAITDVFYEQYHELYLLMDKFDFPYELRDYFIQICELQNVDTTVALSLCQIESWSGHHEGYNLKSESRMYYTKGKATWDLGMFQMSDYYHDYWRDYFFNPELIMSLGYIRNNFSLEDDYISIQVGVSYLGHLYKRLGTYELAVKAYNCGIGNVLNNNIPNITNQYAHAIMNNWTRREGDL